MNQTEYELRILQEMVRAKHGTGSTPFLLPFHWPELVTWLYPTCWGFWEVPSPLVPCNKMQVACGTTVNHVTYFILVVGIVYYQSICILHCKLFLKFCIMPGPAKDPRELCNHYVSLLFQKFAEVRKSTETSAFKHFIAVQVANKQGLAVTVS